MNFNAVEKSNQKYETKTIRFIDTPSHYELIFTNYFVTPGTDNGSNGDILTDVVLDLKNANKNKELHIFVGSYGGEVTALTMLMQQILQFKYRVGINLGYACSCGWMLLFCCQERYVSEYSFNLYHSMSSMAYGKVAEQKNEIIFYEKWWEKIFNSTYTKNVLTEEELKLGETTEVFLTGQELIDRGAAKSYDEYLNRNIPRTTDVFQRGNEIFVPAGNNTYEKYIKVEDEIITYEDLIVKFNDDNSTQEDDNKIEDKPKKSSKKNIKVKKIKKSKK